MAKKVEAEGPKKDNRLWLFFLLTFIFTWLFWVPDALAKQGLIPPSVFTNLGFLGALGPTIIAFVLTLWFEGWVGFKQLILRALNYKFGKKWYAVVFLLMPGIVALSFLVAVLFNGGIIPTSPIATEPWMIFFLFFGVLVTSGPVEEEFGWRGYAQPRLQVRYKPLITSILLGLIWAIWHIPQFFIPGNQMFYKTPFPTFVVTVILATFIFTWVYNHTNGSLLACLFLHTTFNLSMFIMPVLDTTYGYIFVLIFFLVAVILLIVFNSRTKILNLNIHQKNDK